MEVRFSHLLEHVLRNLRRLRLPDLNPADMQLVHHLLHLLSRPSWSGGQGNDAEVRMIRLQVGDALDIGMVAGSFVRLVYDRTGQ